MRGRQEHRPQGAGRDFRALVTRDGDDARPEEMTKLSDVRRAANFQPAVIFEMAYQFLHAHTTLIAEACKGNTVGHTAILPAAGARQDENVPESRLSRRTGYVLGAQEKA